MIDFKELVQLVEGLERIEAMVDKTITKMEGAA